VVSADQNTSVLVVTGGHPFDAPSFFEVFTANNNITWTTSSTPRVGFDVVVFYDMPGITFTRGDPPVVVHQPSAEYRETLTELQDRGTGLVFVHHAIASWPAWDEFAELIGGRFHYQPGEMNGARYPDSGYILDITHTVNVLEPSHPVCDGLDPSFTLQDELYCYPVNESQVLPLMRTTYPVHEPEHFSSADAAIRGVAHDARIWTHPPGSSLVAWAKPAGHSPLVYLQFGDGPSAYGDKIFRKVLAQAITWTASAQAREWASTWIPVRNR
jgi:type 1 glutamine amidotransferase